MSEMRAQVAEERGPCVLMLTTGVELRPEDREAGFRWLDKWDVLMPLLSYTQLARDYGDAAERAETQQLIHHLAQPVYDERVLFVRHGTTADALIAQRGEETCGHDACPLPMLRAIWYVKPLLLALPAEWVGDG